MEKLSNFKTESYIYKVSEQQHLFRAELEIINPTQFS